MTLNRIPSFTLALSALVATVLCIAAEPRQTRSEQSSRPGHSMGQHLTQKGIPNFGQVTPTLYRGAQPNREGIEALAKLGVNVVVDLRGSASRGEEGAATKLGMRYVSIPWHCPWPKDEAMAKFLTVLRDNPGKKVFVHCRLGDDRTGMMIAAYRMADEGWSAEEAMKEMRAFGFSAAHHVICPGLGGYEEKFPERWKKSAAFQELRAAEGTPQTK